MEKNIKMFMTTFGILLGVYEETNEFGQIKLSEPLLMKLEGNAGEANFQPILMNVEWSIVPTGSMEIECHKGFEAAYKEAAQGLFSSIIMPTAQEKASILGG